MIKINYSNSETFFKINNSFSEETPFGKQKSLETEDFRVSFINDLLNDFEKDNNDLEKLARKTILLWKSIDSADISLIQSNN